MDPIRFAKLKEILLTARGLSDVDRREYLDRVCRDDASLRREVDSLLEHETTGASIVRTGGIQDITPPDPDAILDTETEVFPRELGPYVLIGILGRGGMGVVYHAEQTRPLKREVALKLVKRGMDTDRVVARFEAERQTLAALDHPNIARILDAGATEGGRPYFVMELVRGATITEFCDAEQSAIDARLDLFLEICRAVQHAHQKGTIHRDLKPSNVLVTLSDGRPLVKVIDFGIAKAIEEPEGAHAMTMEGQFIGTPDYMSPEQAGIIPDGVDTRTDVYSLGALLYELLTGYRPHRFDTMSHREIMRVIGEEEPEKPSTAVTRRDSSTADVGEQRGSTVDRLRRELSGDLDNIVLMAMRKEPARRYPSVDALAEDIQRYRQGLPVRAHVDTWTYRTSKFIRRHRTWVAAAVVAVVAILGFAINTAVQSQRVARERDRAVAAERTAQEEAETARQASEFLVELFEVSDPSEARGNTITAREILDRGALRIRSELTDQPAVRATLMDAIGRVYQSLGLYPSADTLLTEALETRRELFGEENLEVADSYGTQALLLQDMGRYDEAEPLAERALEIRQALLDDADPIINSAMADLASIRQDLGDLAGSEEMYREVLERDRRLLGANHPYVAVDLNNIANLRNAQGDPEESIVLYREALALHRATVGDDHPEVATTLSNMSNVLQSLGKVDSAVIVGREALELRRRLLGEEHPYVAISMANLATKLQAKGELDSAEVLLRGSVDIRRRNLGDEHPSVAHALLLLGRFLIRNGDLGEAEHCYREALDIQRRSLPEGHAHTARSLIGLGRVFLAREDAAGAEPYLRESLDIRRAAWPPDHPELQDSVWEMGRCERALGRYAEAEPLLLEAYKRRLESRGPENRRVRAIAAELVELYTDMGEPERGAPYRAIAHGTSP